MSRWAELKDLTIYDAYLPNAAATDLGMMYMRGEGVARIMRKP